MTFKINSSTVQYGTVPLEQHKWSSGRISQPTPFHSIQYDQKEVLQPEKQIVFRVVEAGEESEPFTDELAKALVSLWNDKNVQRAADMRSEYQLNDSAK